MKIYGIEFVQQYTVEAESEEEAVRKAITYVEEDCANNALHPSRCMEIPVVEIGPDDE